MSQGSKGSQAAASTGWHPTEAEKVTLISLGVGLGAAALGAAVAVAADRFGRVRTEVDVADSVELHDALGSLRGEPLEVPTGDGTNLYCEIDTPENLDPNLPTLVFAHGYALSQESWHFQRAAVRDKYRCVFFDHRGHGRSPRSAVTPITIDTLGHDLMKVVEATVPQGPVVLIGHSMGGMAVMALANAYPEFFAQRVVGAALIATSSFNLRRNNLGMGPVGRIFQSVSPSVLSAATKYPQLTSKTRDAAERIEQFFVRKYSFASPVSPEVMQFTAALIRKIDVGVLSDYYRLFSSYDKREALAAMNGVESLVLVGANDLMTPPSYSDRIVRRLPHAEHIVVPQAGHLVMLEHPRTVNRHLSALLGRAERAALSLVARPSNER